MTIRNSRRGYFLGCSGYPKCKNTGDVPTKLVEELGLNGTNGKAEKPFTPAAEDASSDANSDGEIETDLALE